MDQQLSLFEQSEQAQPATVQSYSGARFSIILSDPPWYYNQRCTHSKTRFGGGVSRQYPTMTDEEILSLPVWQIAERNAVLFLWATGPRLDLAMRVITAWGFIYKTVGFTWLKQNRSGNGLFFGTGFYAKSNAEFCLLATRGETIKPRSNSVSSAVLSPLQEHSRKPDVVRERIEKMYPDLSKLEMFCRFPREGWAKFGNEVESDITL